MKTAMKLSICLLVMFTSVASSYADNYSSTKDEREKRGTTFTINNVKEGQKLFIKDINGLVLYKESIEEPGVYNNTFDLTTLPNGAYFFEHVKDFQINIVPFTVESGEVNFDKSREKTFYKPVVRLKNNYLYFSKLDLNKDAVNISIYFTENGTDFEEIHSEDITDTLKVERIYRLSKNQTGNYKIVVNSDGREYVEYFNL